MGLQMINLGDLKENATEAEGDLLGTFLDQLANAGNVLFRKPARRGDQPDGSCEAGVAVEDGRANANLAFHFLFLVHRISELGYLLQFLEQGPMGGDGI